MIKLVYPALATAAAIPFAAFAFPDGAPWSVINNPDRACASCHFGSDPVAESEALTVEGVDGPLVPGESYTVTVRFAPEEAEILGFLAAFKTEEGAAGSVAAPADGVEARESSARSNAAVANEGGASWTFDWTAPATAGLVSMHIAGNAANGDGSPLGDAIHVRTLSLEIGEAAE